MFVFVVWDKVCAMELPVPFASPLISVAALTVQASVVPLTELGFVIVTAVIATPEQRL